MKVLQFINHLIQEDIISDKDIALAMSNLIESINLHEYNILVDACNRNSIDKEEVFNSLFMKATEDAQYQMWKDGYVSVCPAKMLLRDLEKEDANISTLINKEYDRYLTHCDAFFDGIQDIILDYISHAEDSIKIAMAWFTNPVIFNRLLRVCKRGVSVELLINNDLINNRLNGLPFNKLIGAGADLYIAEPPKLIHNKFCIIDDNLVIDGSYNWTILAEKHNDENIVVIKNGNVINSFINAFHKLIRNNQHVDEMPSQVPEKQEFDCCSYRNINTEEWLEQISDGVSKKKQREIYKMIFKTLPEDYSIEQIPSEEFDSIKKEVEEERTLDARLFKESIDETNEELTSRRISKEFEINRISEKVSGLENKKAIIREKNQQKVERIKNKRIPNSQKEELLETVRKENRRELQKINRVISSQNTLLSSLRSDLDILESQQTLVNSIKESDLKGSNGLCRINLKWNTEDDLDLHLILPNGTIDTDSDVYYSHMRTDYQGGVCSLDHDAIPDSPNENPQENIQWENCIPDGTYRIAVKLFNKKSNNINIPFSVSIFSDRKAKTEVFNFIQANSKDIIEVTSLTFKNGKLKAPIVFKK
jgi:hypothetical protein